MLIGRSDYSASRGRGREVERLVEARFTAGVILPPEESVRIMGTLDEIRRQIGVVWDEER